MGKKNNIWNREEDGNRKEQRSFIRYAIVATAIMVLFLFVKKDNVVRWIQAGFTLRRQERQIELYQQQNEELDKTINMMSNNRDTLEKFARENFHFAEPGEDVYIEE
ncbi:MAG: septum formation initiator family protein [Bacteroidales bacterium]|mgnify:CR=1 FL=1|nr:septum formation initiator family protein [Bacteroidales bacterium]